MNCATVMLNLGFDPAELRFVLRKLRAANDNLQEGVWDYVIQRLRLHYWMDVQAVCVHLMLSPQVPDLNCPCNLLREIARAPIRCGRRSGPY